MQLNDYSNDELAYRYGTLPIPIYIMISPSIAHKYIE